MQTMYMLYTSDSLCNNVDISANAGIPDFDQPKHYLPRNVSAVAKAITCKHYTCCIHVDSLCNNVDISTFSGITKMLVYQEMSALLQKKSRVNTINVTLYMLFTRDSLCNNVDISAYAGIPYFDQLKRHLPRNVSTVAKAISCKQCTQLLLMYMLYTSDSLCNDVDISTFAGIPYFDKLKH